MKAGSAAGATHEEAPMARLADKILEAAATHCSGEAQIEFLNGVFRMVREEIDKHQATPKHQRDVLFGDFAFAVAIRLSDPAGRA
jgi:hypothetical protein